MPEGGEPACLPSNSLIFVIDHRGLVTCQSHPADEGRVGVDQMELASFPNSDHHSFLYSVCVCVCTRVHALPEPTLKHPHIALQAAAIVLRITPSFLLASLTYS